MARLSEAESRAIRERLGSIRALAVAVVVAGVVLGVPALVPVGLLIGALALVRDAWTRRGLRGIEYQRELATGHAVWGDTVRMTVTVRNRSWLPVPWLTADDPLSEPITIEGGTVLAEEATEQRWLRNAWTLWPFERVEREFRLRADRRCRVAFGPVHLESADLFAGTAAAGDLPAPAELSVAPRSLPVVMIGARTRWSAQQHAIPGLPEDPVHVAGVRPYLPGDSPRRIHWKATARTGTPLSKRFDASREREMLLAVDVQTLPGRPPGVAYDPDLLEAICVTAASIVRDAIASGSRCGLAAAAYTYRPRTDVRILPGTGSRQLLTLMDALARLGPYASAPFESLLAGLPRWLPLQTRLIVITGREPELALAVLRRLRSLGYGMEIIAVGAVAPSAVERARSAGFRALTAELAPDWRSADALALVG